MTETYTGGTVKISCPSNYAENRRGSEVTLSFALPEGTTCEQADEATRRVRLLALKHVLAGQSGDVSDVGFLSLAPVPETTAEPPKRTRKPASEITIGASIPSASATEPATPEAAPSPATTTAPAGPSEAPPFAAAPTEPQPARPTFAQPEATVLPPTPTTTGTAVQHNPFAAGPAVSEAQPASEPASTVAGISDEQLTALSIEQAKRINGILPQQGGNIVNQVIARYVQPPRGLKSIPMEQRATYVAELQAWSPA